MCIRESLSLSEEFRTEFSLTIGDDEGEAGSIDCVTREDRTQTTFAFDVEQGRCQRVRSNMNREDICWIQQITARGIVIDVGLSCLVGSCGGSCEYKYTLDVTRISSTVNRIDVRITDTSD